MAPVGERKPSGFSHLVLHLHPRVVPAAALPLPRTFGLGGAALVTETVFNLPGIGQYEANAIGNLDVPPIMVGTMFTAFFVVLFSALSDVVYALLDPRIRITG